MKKPCPRYDAEFTKARNLPEIKALEIKYRDLFDYLSAHTGSKVNTVENAEYIHSTLYIEVNRQTMLSQIMKNSRLFTYFHFLFLINFFAEFERHETTKLD